MMETLVLKRWTPSRKPITVPPWGLRELKAARAVSTSELAAAAGVDRATVTRALGGVRPSPRTRRALARALGVEPDMVRWTSEPRQEEAN
jgi:transcriptional regulator with XRE-family HTH domain